MNDYVIFIDSSADIAPSFAKEHDIHIVSMSYSVDGEEYNCNCTETDIILKQFYDKQRNVVECHTCQVSPQQFIDAFAPIMESGRDILYISLSGGLTNTHDSITLAKMQLFDEYPERSVYDIDSLSATVGIGLLAEMAAFNRDSGMSVEENASYIEEMRHRICHIFMVEDLMYLKRGGRIPASTALIGTALNIKPILVIDEEGKLQVVDKKRGNKTAVKSMMERYMRSRDEKEHRIRIVHADAPGLAGKLTDEVAKRDVEADITTEILSPIIGSHTGPGMAAVVYIGRRLELQN